VSKPLEDCADMVCRYANNFVPNPDKHIQETA